MAFDRSNVIVDRYVRGNGYDIATGERMYSLTQIKDANLKVTMITAQILWMPKAPRWKHWNAESAPSFLPPMPSLALTCLPIRLA